MTDTNQSSSRTPDFRTWALLAAILLLAFGLRVYRLADQSVWHDEFLAMGHFNAPNVQSNIALMDLYMPCNMRAPLYYILQYFVAHYFSDSLVVLRLMAVTLGVLGVLALFLLVRRQLGVSAALVASLCLALSPQHIWYSQEPRTYALSFLLAFLAFHATYCAVQEGSRRWWASSLLINAVMPWTHLLLGFAVFTQGVFLMWHWRARLRRFALWVLLQSALLLPLICHLFPPPLFLDGGDRTNWNDLFTGLFGVDAVAYYPDLMPPWKNAPATDLPGWVNAALQLQTPMNLAMVALFLVVLACLLTGLFRAATKRAASPCSPGAAPLVFALVLWLVPMTTLAIMNDFARKPFLSFMYGMYGLAGAYAAVGYAVTRIRTGHRRRAAVLMLAAIYAYQLLIFLPLTTRTDWQSLTQHIRTESAAGDMVLNFEIFGPVNPFDYYRNTLQLPVKRVNTLQAVCDEATDSFVSGRVRQTREDHVPSVWVVYRQFIYDSVFPDSHPVQSLSAGLAARGLQVEKRVFWGMYDATVLRITPIPGRQVTRSDEPIPTAVKYDDILGRVRPELNTPEARKKAEQALRRHIPIWPCVNPFVVAAYAMDLICADRPDLAEAVSRCQLSVEEKFGSLHYALGAALLAQGREQEAVACFDKAFQYQDSLRQLTGEFLKRLIERKDMEGARHELERMKSMGWAFYLPCFEHILGAHAANQKTTPLN